MPKLFVGNLPFDVTDDELKSWVERHGHQVEELRLMRDRETGKARGFAFVTLDGKVSDLIAAFNGQEFKGRALAVNEAKPMERRNSGGGSDRGRGRREPRW